MTIKNKYVKTALGNKMMLILDWMTSEVKDYITISAWKDYARGSSQIKQSEVEALVKQAIELNLIKIKEDEQG